MCRYGHKTITMCKGIMSMALINLIHVFLNSSNLLIVLILLFHCRLCMHFSFVPQRAKTTRTVASRGFPLTYSIQVLSSTT